MRSFALAPLAASLLLLAAAPVAAPTPVPAPAAPGSHPTALSVVCESTPFYLFIAGQNEPVLARTPRARAGQRFALVSGPRTTLEGFDYYETDVSAIEPGYTGSHYWISRDCAIPIA